MKFPKFLGAAYFLAIACSLPCLPAPALAQTPVPSPTQPADPVPLSQAVINEVCFDPEGIAGSEGTYQWVEIVTKARVNVGGWQIRNAANQVLYTLPSIGMPRGGYLVVLLGPSDPSVENTNPLSGPVVLTSGHPYADHIGVQIGGVKLFANGAVMDQVGWGTGSPVNPVVPIEYPAAFFLEGDSLGRNSSAADTNTASDWALDGGPNSNGPTPGEKNIVTLPPENDAIFYQDNYLNQTLVALSITDTVQGWITITDSNATPVSYSASGDTAVCVSHHALDVTINGTSTMLSGTVVGTYSRTVGNLDARENYTISGSIADPSGFYRLDVNFARSTSNIHVSPQSTTYSGQYDWNEGTASYPVTVTGTMATNPVSATAYTQTENRTVIDFSNYGPKTATAAATRSRTGDGQFALSYSVAHSFPGHLPYPGGDHSWGIGMIAETSETCTATLDGIEQYLASSITAYEAKLNGLTVQSLRPAETGWMSTTITPISGGIQFSEQQFLPLDYFGSNYDLHVEYAGSAITLNGKLLLLADISRSENGVVNSSLGIAVDPPAFTSLGGGQKAFDFAFQCATCIKGATEKMKKMGKKAAAKWVAKKMAAAQLKKLIPIYGAYKAATCLYEALRDY